MLDTEGLDGKPVIWKLPISEAILQIERGAASCSIPIEELKRLQHAYFFRELELTEKIKALENRVGLLQEDLSFLFKYKPIIDKLTKITHTLKIVWDKVWWIICSLAVILGLYWGFKQEGWLPKQELPVSIPSQTSSDLRGSGASGGYTGNKTHSHNPVSILPFFRQISNQELALLFNLYGFQQPKTFLQACSRFASHESIINQPAKKHSFKVPWIEYFKSKSIRALVRCWESISAIAWYSGIARAVSSKLKRDIVF